MATVFDLADPFGPIRALDSALGVRPVDSYLRNTRRSTPQCIFAVARGICAGSYCWVSPGWKDPVALGIWSFVGHHACDDLVV